MKDMSRPRFTLGEPRPAFTPPGDAPAPTVAVAVTLTFSVDSEKWAQAYGDSLTGIEADVRSYFENLTITDLAPAWGEWGVTDPEPTTRVSARLNRQ